MILANGGKKSPTNVRCASHGFTLVEVLISVGILSLVLLANLSAVAYSRAQMAKDRERGVVLDFISHYLELAKALPFAEVSPNMPINTLYDGTSGAPNIRFPSNTDWFSISTEDYQAFHPELVWLTPRNPQMRVTLTTTKVGGLDHTKQITVEVQWDTPSQTERIDMIREVDM